MPAWAAFVVTALLGLDVLDVRAVVGLFRLVTGFTTDRVAGLFLTFAAGLILGVRTFASATDCRARSLSL